MEDMLVAISELLVCSVCVEDTAVTTGEVVILIEDGMDVSVMATNYNMKTIHTSEI